MNEWRNIYLCFVPFVCPFVVLAPCERAAHFSSSTENSFLFERKQHPEEQYAIIWTGWKVNTDVGSRGHASEHVLFHHVQHTHTHTKEQKSSENVAFFKSDYLGSLLATPQFPLSFFNNWN